MIMEINNKWIGCVLYIIHGGQKYLYFNTLDISFNFFSYAWINYLQYMSQGSHVHI